MRKSVSTIIGFTDKIMSLIILATIFIVISFAVFEIWKIYIHFGEMHSEDVLHATALTIVFVKAYRMLLYYLQSQHVSVKYIVEISIIAPAVDLIFAWGNRPFEINVLFALFSAVMLIIYLVFYKRLNLLNKAHIREGDPLLR